MIDDEIDLRPYVQGLLRYWPLIVALTLISTALAAVYSLRQANLYEAIALVSVSTPRYNVQPDGSSPAGQLPVHAYPELAESGDVLAAVLTQTQAIWPAASPNRPNEIADLQDRLSAEAASDPTLVRLKVQDQDPQAAALLANVWAQVFAAHAGALYGQDQANLQLYTSQLAEAKTALDQAENDLATFQSANQAAILTAQLDSQQSSLTDYLNRRHNLQLLSQDTSDLVDRLGALPASAPASTADDLTLLAIAGQIYGSGTLATDTRDAASSLPVQVQLTSGQPLAGPAVADQLALATRFRDAITARLADIDKQVTSLQPQILALQGQVAEAQVKQNELDQTQDLATSNYTKLAGQVQDATLVSEASSNSVQIASRAAVPSTKIGPHRTTSVALGAAVGLVLGVVLALALVIWRSWPAAAKSS